MKHEFDSPVRSENDYFTVSHVSEVLPGAMSPLGADVFNNLWSIVFKKQAVVKGLPDTMMSSRYFLTGIMIFYSHMMFSLVEWVTRYGFNTPMSKGFMVSMFGRVLDDPGIIEYVQDKVENSAHPSVSLIRKIKNFWALFSYDHNMDEVKQKMDNYHLNFLKPKTAKETFSAILRSCSDFYETALRHMENTESSSQWNTYMFQILSDSNKGCLNNDVYSDFARLLSTSTNVESADVPQALQAVAVEITKHISSEKFKSMSEEEALEWLEKSTSLAGYKYRQFIKRHGHRCIREFDLRSIPWGMDPKLLVKLLQNLAGFAKEGEGKVIEDDMKIFSELNVPLGYLSKYKLKFVLPNCRRAVRAREASKALVVKGLSYWRQGFRSLAKQMVSEGRIPDADLIFFLHVEEIKELLETRSPSIISRAISRRKMFPTLEDYKFPEIMHGLPKPINDAAESAETYEFVADLTMKGVPVSQGVTKGYARVALTVEEASHLKKGEILITISTDIGWSPYFPIISGVVTELGGLISHGAVVSREYGLPCVVGLLGATKRFQTGDYVLLDGKKGILQRLPRPEN